MDSRTNYKNMLLALLLILAGLAGAIAPQTAAAEPVVKPEALYVPAEGGKYEVTLSCNRKHCYLEELDFPAWIECLSYIGYRSIDKEGVRYTFFFTPNFGAERKIDIVFKTNQGDVKLHVTQAAGSKSDAKFTFNPEVLNVDDNERTYNLKLSCDRPYTIYNIGAQNNSWVRIDILSGPEAVQKLAVKIKANPGKQREQLLTFYTSVGEAKLKVTQTAAGTKPEGKFTLEPKELKVDANRNKVSFTLSCNMPYRIDRFNMLDWTSVSGYSTKYEAVQEMTILIEANPGPERKNEITFHTTCGKVKLKVTQAAAGTKGKFTLEPKELDVEANAGSANFTLSCDVPYNITGVDKPDWLSVSGNSGALEAIQKMRIAVQTNPGSKREGVITFKTTAGDVKLKVTQAAAGTKPEPKAPKLTLNPEELEVDASAQKKKVTLTSDVPVHINRVSAPGWIDWSEESNEADSKYTLTIGFMANNGGTRGDGVTFFVSTESGKEYTVTLFVKQKGMGETPGTAKFTLEPKELKVEAKGGMKEVTLSCNKEFLINQLEVPDWISNYTYYSTAAKSNEIKLFISQNTGAERTGNAVFKTNQGNITLKVTQAGKKEKPEPTLTLSPDMLTFSAGGGKQTVNVKSDYGWDTKASAASASWMKLTTDVKTGKIVVEVTPNTSTKKRGATIEVVSSRRRIGSRNPITRRILVTQEAAKAVEPPVAATGISLNPAAMTMGSGGGTVGFNVYAGKGWTISGSPEWMHPDATRGSGTRLVIVRFDRNESGAERTGKLTVKSDDGKAERTFTLTQRAGQRKPTPSPGSTPSEEYDYDLALNPEEITVGPSDGAGSSISVATSRLWAGSTTEDWIRLESAVGRGNGTFTFRLAPNPSKEMRHGTITVRTQQGMDELKVAIHQQGNDGSIVPPAEVKVSNVTLDPATLTVNGDLSTALISAIVSPDNARNKGLLWMSSNASVATVQVFTPKQSAALPQLRFAPDADDYALVTIVGKGKAVITAAASDGSGIVARCEVNVLSTVANTVPYAPQAKVYTVGPTLYLSLPTPETVQVYTLAGTLYRTWQAPAGDTSLTLPAGTYIIKVGPLTEKVAVR